MTSENLCESIAKISNRECILMFSRGKDSIAAYYQLKKFFKKIILVYKHMLPDLMSFEVESLKYFENLWQTEIKLLPSTSLYRQINGYMFQTPETARTIYQIGLPTWKDTDYDALLPEDLGCKQAWRAIGVRASDSPIRRFVINKHGAFNEKLKSFYPVYDWTADDLRKCFRENAVKLPEDYEIWGKSFDGFDYRFIKPLKENFPQDYETIKRYFPLIDLEIMRYEQI